MIGQPTDFTYTAENKPALQARLRRIEGQIRGLQKMLDDNRDCREVIQQLTAVRAAIETTLALYTQSYVKNQLLTINGDPDSQALVEEVIGLLARKC